MSDAALKTHASTAGMTDNREGMTYLETLPRKMVTVYMPLAIILVVLLFPFYWMVITSIKPDAQLLDLDNSNPLWVTEPTLQHIKKLLFESAYPRWLMTTMMVATAATFLSIFASVLAAYAITRIRYKGAATVGGLIFLAYLVPPSILFIPLSAVIHAYGLFDTPFALILTYPTILIPFCTWLLMGYFKTIPYELEECADHNKTVPVAIISNFVDGDIFRWGSLMAGALIGSLPLVILYAFFVEHYVSAMTGAVKE